jgi:hypothetical protein
MAKCFGCPINKSLDKNDYPGFTIEYDHLVCRNLIRINFQPII